MFDVHQQIDNIIRGTNMLNSLTLPALSPQEMAVPLKPLVHPAGIPRMTLYLPYHVVLKKRWTIFHISNTQSARRSNGVDSTSVLSFVFGKVIYDRGRVFYKSRFVSGLLLLIRPLTAVCWTCEQALVFGFALKLLFRAQPPIKPPTATYGKLIYSPVKRNVTWTKGKTEPKTLSRSNPHKNCP